MGYLRNRALFRASIATIVIANYPRLRKRQLRDSLNFKTTTPVLRIYERYCRALSNCTRRKTCILKPSETVVHRKAAPPLLLSLKYAKSHSLQSYDLHMAKQDLKLITHLNIYLGQPLDASLDNLDSVTGTLAVLHQASP